MTPQLFVAVGLVLLAAGVATLLSFGSGYRVGRLLTTAPLVTIGEAIALARSGERRFVRVDGRIDADDEFEDFDHKPLVYRRTRFERRPGPAGAWQTLDLQVEAVPFRLNEGLDSIEVDRAALGDGLVVIPKRSVGVVGDLGDRVAIVPGQTSPTDAARVTVEQVSSIEHAIAAGVPALDPEGAPTLTAGGGRPLLLTTLEIPEAMRILTGGALWRSRAAALALVGGATILAVGAAWWLGASLVNPAIVLADSPLPSVLPGGADTRSSGEGPGLVGNPALAVLGVLGIALIAVVATIAYVRLTANRGSEGPSAGRS
ncbi:MAG TPA: hypothetical protein VKR30_09870 [Candidatus Limnocylindrales bacterium]|nr:hypothetical protein [Candidatus Limnocylindrales bacterium]